MSRGILKLVATGWLIGLAVMSVSSQALRMVTGSPGSPAADSQNQSPCGLQPSLKVDAYGGISLGDERARLDKFAALLNSESEDVRGFIVAYGGRRAVIGEALARADRAKEYLVEKNVFYNSRLNTVDCGYREEQATELWITPVGAAPPLCSPTLKLTEVQIKGRGRQPPSSRRVSNKSSF